MALIERPGPPLEPALGPAKPDPGAGVSGQNYARVSHTLGVMAGLVPAIHVLSHARQLKTWMPATSAGMTEERQCGHKAGHDRGEPKKVVDARIKPGMTGESGGAVARSGAAFC
jgi:hypothetical protein